MDLELAVWPPSGFGSYPFFEVQTNLPNTIGHLAPVLRPWGGIFFGPLGGAFPLVSLKPQNGVALNNGTPMAPDSSWAETFHSALTTRKV